MSALAAVRSAAKRLDGSERDYDALIERAHARSFVLLGEATHGTAEFYRMRAEITRRLIEESGFDAVAVEADWPDAYRLDRFVRGDAHDARAFDAFADFERFPQWMWRNVETERFIAWLSDHNQTRAPDARVGFYGLDMYSLYRSAEQVVDYLERVDQEQAALARQQYAALDHVRDPQTYGYEAAAGLRPDCRDAVRGQLVALVHKAPDYLSGDGRAAADAQFFAEMNAHVVLSAEAYYREQFGNRVDSWNLRDEHMARTLFALRSHLRAQGREGGIVVWAHNSHLGDARATQMGRSGEWNVGQLVRQTAGAEHALLIGFTTYTGTVTAARAWGGAAEEQRVQPARADSYEGLFHASRLDRFYLPLTGEDGARVREPMLERAIGVLYRPHTELQSHYFDALIAQQFDALFHLDETRAVEPPRLGDPHMPREFTDRLHAAAQLAVALSRFHGTRPLVLAIPRGGVPIAEVVARALQGDLDVVLVRKLGAPRNPELAVGAVDEAGRIVVNPAASRLGADEAYIRSEAARQLETIHQRRNRYSPQRAPLDARNRTVIVIDDGLATGATMSAALASVRAQQPARLICAVPVAAHASLEAVSALADEVICLSAPRDFHAVGQFYRDFSEVSDADVIASLRPPKTPPGEARGGERPVRLSLGAVELDGDLVVPEKALGLVVFAHGSGSSRRSPRNRQVAQTLNRRGFATLLFDLLSAEEDRQPATRFDIALLSRRLHAALAWARSDARVGSLPVGLFGASTGAAAAIDVAAVDTEGVDAVVSRGGRPDLAEPAALEALVAPTLLIVGDADIDVLLLNRRARRQMHGRSELALVAGATHLFEEPGALERVAELAASWFANHMAIEVPAA